MAIEVADLRRRVHTSLSNPDLEGYLNDAKGWVKGRCDNEDAPFDETNGGVREATLLYATGIVTMFDLSANVRPVSLTEGDVSIKFQGLGGHQPVIDQWKKWAMEELQPYLAKHAKTRRPRYRVKRSRSGGLRGVSGHGDF